MKTLPLMATLLTAFKLTYLQAAHTHTHTQAYISSLVPTFGEKMMKIHYLTSLTTNLQEGPTPPIPRAGTPSK